MATSTTTASISYRFGRFELLPAERQLLVDGTAVHLGAHAFDLLLALVERSGHLVTKDELLERVWPRAVVEENTLQVHVSALRKVLGVDAIATISGRGYRLALEVKSSPVSGAEAASRRHNLPHQLTSFIGREKQIQEIKRLVSSSRLTTLTGAGGCGKTRLALRILDDIVDDYVDGVWHIELASLADSTLVPQAVARVLKVPEQAGKTVLEALAESLAVRHLLLVLDNAEHVLSACAQLSADLLRKCPRLAILVTSREPLGVAGEQTLRVPSLSVPGMLETTNFEVLACEAARLFIDRARLQRSDFDVTPRDMDALASICRRLDGIALAIELAAPRIRTMSIEELSGRIDQRFSLLTGGSRTALPRHRTLRSLIDWSYDLLTDSEKTVLQRTSVFAGGWTVEAAECVCSGGHIQTSGVLDLVTSLTDKNLFAADTRGGVTRFGMLETVRHYAHDQLSESGEEEVVRARHCQYYLDVVAQVAVPQSDTDIQARMSRWDHEHDNLRGAMAWCEGDARRALQGLWIAGRLSWFWRTRGHLTEGRSWIARLLAAAPSGEHGEVHALAHSVAGILAYLQTDFAGAEAHQRKVLAIGEDLEDKRYVLTALGNLGGIALDRGEHAAARDLMEQALAMARKFGNPRHVTVLLQNLGCLALRLGEFPAAQALLEEGLTIGRQIGRWSAAELLADLGRVRHAQGDNEAARTLFMQALDGQREFENKSGVAKILTWLAAASHDAGDIPAAKKQLREALTILQAVAAESVIVASALENSAGLLVDLARPTDAVQLWSRAQRLREESLAPHGVPERARCQRQIAQARRALHDDATFDLAWNKGRSLALDEAMRYAGEQLK